MKYNRFNLRCNLRKMIPINIQGLKDENQASVCFLKTIIDNIDFNFATNMFHGKALLNKTMPYLAEYTDKLDDEDLCHLEPVDRSSCSISESKRDGEGNSKRNSSSNSPSSELSIFQAVSCMYYWYYLFHDVV